MLIGIDFDNTIVSYDALFYKVALEQSLIPVELEVSKVKVRDYLRNQNNEDAWTEMQGYVYGARMDEAEAFPGLLEFMQWAKDSVFELAIVSHKTKHPFIGKKYDLHAAASQWIETNLMSNNYICPENIYFELTKEEKVERIKNIGCTFFIDDLPEILFASGFPPTTKKILFDPVDNHKEVSGTLRVKNWEDVKCLLQRTLNKSI